MSTPTTKVIDATPKHASPGIMECLRFFFVAVLMVAVIWRPPTHEILDLSPLEIVWDPEDIGEGRVLHPAIISLPPAREWFSFLDQKTGTWRQDVLEAWGIKPVIIAVKE